MDGVEIGSKDQVNFLKGLAITAVVTIHLVNNLYRFAPPSGNLLNILVAVDQLSRFCVPFFVMLSGFALAKKYADQKIEFGEFFTRRLLRLLPLYLLWTVVYFVSGKILFGFDNLGTVEQWVKMLFLGQGYYHLYFVPMIVQAYLAFPLLFWAVKKQPFIALVISGLLQIGIMILISTPGWTDQIQYILFTTWQFYFVAGIYLARVKTIKYPLFYIVAAVLGFWWLLVTTFNDMSKGADIIWATRFTRWPIAVYAIGLALGLLGRNTKSGLMVFLGKHSYLIYLSHVLFLQLIIGGNISLPVILTLFLGIVALMFSIKLKG